VTSTPGKRGKKARPAPPLLSQAKYAEHRGVSRNAVHIAVRTGRIPTTPDGKIDPAIADAAWEANTDPSSPRSVVTGNPYGPNGGAPNGLSSASQTLHAHKVRQAEIDIAMSELALERERGHLVPAADVEKEAFETARRVRDALASMPDRLAPVLAGILDPLEVRRVLADEVRKACAELAGSPEPSGAVAAIEPAEQVPASVQAAS